MSYKFALINDGIVENIIEAQNYEYIDVIKPQYDAVVPVDNVYVEIGFLWNGAVFSENPKVQENMDYSREIQYNEMEASKKENYAALNEKYKNDPNSLSPDEKAALEAYKIEYGELP